MSTIGTRGTLVEINLSALASNDAAALALRRRFSTAGTKVANLISSPGTGKTELVVRLCEEASRRGVRMAVLVGDCATDNDARRIATAAPHARQIVTDGLCHLEAAMVEAALEGWELEEIDLLVIENVGNLVCPSGFDLGENVKVALVSVTEGEDKPVKYPHLFSSAGLVVITKVDLAEACETDMEELHSNVRAVNPTARCLETSAKRGTGLAGLLVSLIGGEDVQGPLSVDSGRWG